MSKLSPPPIGDPLDVTGKGIRSSWISWLQRLYAWVTRVTTSSIRTVTTVTDKMLESDSGGTLVFAGSAGVTETLLDPVKYPGSTLRLITTVAHAVDSASSNVLPISGGAAGTTLLSATAGKWCDIQSNGIDWQVTAGN